MRESSFQYVSTSALFPFFCRWYSLVMWALHGCVLSFLNQGISPLHLHAPPLPPELRLVLYTEGCH